MKTFVVLFACVAVACAGIIGDLHGPYSNAVVGNGAVSVGAAGPIVNDVGHGHGVAIVGPPTTRVKIVGPGRTGSIVADGLLGVPAPVHGAHGGLGLGVGLGGVGLGLGGLGVGRGLGLGLGGLNGGIVGLGHGGIVGLGHGGVVGLGHGGIVGLGHGGPLLGGPVLDGGLLGGHLLGGPVLAGHGLLL